MKKGKPKHNIIEYSEMNELSLTNTLQTWKSLVIEIGKFEVFKLKRSILLGKLFQKFVDENKG